MTKKDMAILRIKTIILFLVLFLFSSCEEDDYDKEHLKEKRTLYFSKCDEFFYIYGYTYGMLGNHAEIIISKNKNKNKNPKTDIYFKGGLIFYKIKSDTLYLFVQTKKEIPNNLKTKVKIIQKELEGYEMTDLLDSYPKNGLQKIELR